MSLAIVNLRNPFTKTRVLTYTSNSGAEIILMQKKITVSLGLVCPIVHLAKHRLHILNVSVLTAPMASAELQPPGLKRGRQTGVGRTVARGCRCGCAHRAALPSSAASPPRPLWINSQAADGRVALLRPVGVMPHI